VYNLNQVDYIIFTEKKADSVVEHSLFGLNRVTVDLEIRRNVIVITFKTQILSLKSK
jgi:hypothetical protein